MNEQDTRDAEKFLRDKGEFAGDLHTEEVVLNIGPSHPSMHGTIRVLAKLDGETIVDSDTEIGYLTGRSRSRARRGAGSRRSLTRTGSTTTRPS